MVRREDGGAWGEGRGTGVVKCEATWVYMKLQVHRDTAKNKRCFNAGPACAHAGPTLKQRLFSDTSFSKFERLLEAYSLVT